MKKIFFFVFILGGAFVSANSQTVPPKGIQTVVSTTRSGTFEPRKNDDDEKVDQIEGKRRDSRNNPIYRKPGREDLLLVAPDRQTAAQYAEFLRQPKTGLIRLLSDAGCQENANLVSADEFCIKYQKLFGASSYSFRAKNYTHRRFSDVVYKDGVIYAYGKMTLGFLADLGTGVSLSEVSARTAGAKYVFDFAPPEKLSEIEAAALNFQKGVEAGGFSYRKFRTLEENHTYLLRSIAYRRREQVEQNKVVYDDLTNDNRRDVIVVFEVVKLSETEGVTVLWKELQRKDAAKIEMNKK